MHCQGRVLSEEGHLNVFMGMEERAQLWGLLEGNPVFLHRDPLPRAVGMRGDETEEESRGRGREIEVRS